MMDALLTMAVSNTFVALAIVCAAALMGARSERTHLAHAL